MTENETIARMRHRIKIVTDIARMGSDGKAYEDMKGIIKALEEIQQYRAIEPVGECREAIRRQIGKEL